MITEKRITAEEVVKAFQETRVSLEDGSYFSNHKDNPCACGMGALYIQKRGLKKEELIQDYYRISKIDKLRTKCNDYMDEEYGFMYKTGFAGGFDGKKQTIFRNTPRGQQGYEDGKKAKEACVIAFGL